MEFETYNVRQSRLRILVIITCILMVILGCGLGYRQIVLGDAYRDQELRQNFRRILIPGPRGNIYDRNGHLLVGNRPLFSAVVYLNELRPAFRDEYLALVRQARSSGATENRRDLQIRARGNVVQQYLDRVNTILGREITLDYAQIERHFSQNLLLPFTLISDLSEEEYARLIEQLPVDSPLQVIADSARYYPHGSAAAHTLGFVTNTDNVSDEGLPGDALLTFRFKGKIGRSGIEQAFDEHLQGTSGGEIWVVDPSGFQYELTEHRLPVQGNDLHLSLDLDLQLAAERKMAPFTGALVAMDVRTGEVLAIASRPGFDLNDLTPFIPRSVDDAIRESGGWLNRPIQGLYPPGSTFKLITASAILRAGLVSESTTVHCPGYHFVGNRRFHCHNRSGHGDEDLIDAISDSCNVFFYEMGVQLGPDPLASEARLYGLDRQTGIEVPAETHRMIVPDPAWKRAHRGDAWFAGDTANLSIGQGFLLVTPLQMAAFTASFARGETLTQPSILLHDETFVPRHNGRRIGIQPAQYATIVAGMERSATIGTGRLVNIPGIRIAAKTGTAEVRPGGKDLTLAWFVGFAPIDDPQIAIAVLIEGTDPTDNYHGGSTAAPVAREVFRTYFQKHGMLSEFATGLNEPTMLPVN